MKYVLAIMIALLSTTATAQVGHRPGAYTDYATITNVQQLFENRVVGRNCSVNQPVQQEHSATGAIVGGIAGGLLGHQVGKGRGNTATTIIGAVGGAVVGDKIGNQTQQQGTVCQDVVQQFSKGYNYTANYHGATITGTTQRSISVGSSIRVYVVTSVTPAE